MPPRHQRALCETYSERPSGARPSESGSFRKTVRQPYSCSRKVVSMSSVTVSVAMPPASTSACTRNTAEVPQQKAAPQASLQGISTLKKKRCSSGHSRAISRLVCSGSALKKCCGVWTMPTSGGVKSGRVRLRMRRLATKSASSSSTNSGGRPVASACASPLFTLPALACLPLTRRTYFAPSSAARSRTQSRAPSSSTQTRRSAWSMRSAPRMVRSRIS